MARRTSPLSTFSPTGFVIAIAGVCLLVVGLALLAAEDWRLVVPVLLVGALSLPMVTKPLGVRPGVMWSGVAAGMVVAGGFLYILPPMS